MKFTLPGLLLLVAVWVSCHFEEMPSSSITLFAWLNGQWQMKHEDGITTEAWNTINDTLMTGRSDFLKGDSLVPFETMRLYKTGNTFFFEVTAAGQNKELPVIFKISVFSDSNFIAENQAHDFPKRIIYNRCSLDSLHAFVDGGTTEPEKRADFYYSRIR
jgi:hypothetical protein